MSKLEAKVKSPELGMIRLNIAMSAQYYCVQVKHGYRFYV